MSSEPLPTDAEDLGEPVDAFKVGAFKIIVFWVGGVLALVIGIGLCGLLIFELVAGHMRYVAKTLIGAVAFLGGGVSMLGAASRSGNMRFLIFENGMTQLRREDFVSVRWDAVRVVQRLENPKTRDKLSDVSDLLAVTAEDGTTLRLGPAIGRFRNLRLLIESRTLPYLLPRAVEQLRQTGVVTFGPVTVDEAGLHHATVYVPWEKLGRAYTGKGQVHICVRDRKRPVISVPLDQAPNVHVLVELANGSRAEPMKSDEDATGQS